MEHWKSQVCFFLYKTLNRRNKLLSGSITTAKDNEIKVYNLKNFTAFGHFI